MMDFLLQYTPAASIRATRYWTERNRGGNKFNLLWLSIKLGECQRRLDITEEVCHGPSESGPTTVAGLSLFPDFFSRRILKNSPAPLFVDLFLDGRT